MRGIAPFFIAKIEVDNVNAIAKALYTAAMNQDKKTTEIIERRFGKGESRIKICQELYISDRTYYRRLNKFFEAIRQQWQSFSVIIL